jgi:hypothetical protein
VLTRHQLVRRDGEGYRLVPDVEELTHDEHEELLRLCDEAVENYTGASVASSTTTAGLPLGTSRALRSMRFCVELGSAATSERK